MGEFNDIIGMKFKLEDFIEQEFKEFIHPYNNKPVFIKDYTLFHNDKYFIFTKHDYHSGDYEVLTAFVDENYRRIR